MSLAILESSLGLLPGQMSRQSQESVSQFLMFLYVELLNANYPVTLQTMYDIMSKLHSSVLGPGYTMNVAITSYYVGSNTFKSVQPIRKVTKSDKV